MSNPTCIRCGNILMGFEQRGDICNECLNKGYGPNHDDTSDEYLNQQDAEQEHPMSDHTYGTMVWHTCGHLDTHIVTKATQSAIRQREGAQPCEYCREHPEQEPATQEEIEQMYHEVFAD